MRVFFAILMLFLSVVFSQYLLKKYSDRTKFFSDFNSFNNKMLNQINFEKRTLISMLNDLEENDFNKKLKIYCNNLKEDFNLQYLTEDDNLTLNEYFELLGRSDQSTQNKHLLMYEKIINEKLTNAKIEEKEKKTLYLKMGLMIGLILFIIII